MYRTKILHVLRAPVGGLFRHVLDLAREQSRLGYAVGIVCAAEGDALTDQRLAEIAPDLELGVHRAAMGRGIGYSDVSAARAVMTLAERLAVDVLHGHGAKGGVYARLAGRRLKRSGRLLRCFYTPHGGTLHFAPTTLAGRIYRAAERFLEPTTDGILFESAFAAERYAAQIGAPKVPVSVVPNGLIERDFDTVTPDADAAQFLFIGELRLLKGVDILIAALAILNRTAVLSRTPAVDCAIVGDGPDRALFEAQVAEAGLSDQVRFLGALPAHDAFRRGRALVVPSRAESLPYVVLEAGAAELPIIATRVGGIPEIITAPEFGILIGSEDADALADAMADILANPDAARARAQRLQTSVASRFTVQSMAAAVLRVYGVDAGASAAVAA